MKLSTSFLLTAALALSLLSASEPPARAAEAGEPPDTENPTAFRESPKRRSDRATESHRHAQKRAGGMQLLDQFKKDSPEEFRELMELREEDPAAFRLRLRKHMKEAAKRRRERISPQREKQVRALVEEWRQAETDAEKEKVRSKLRTELGEVFDEKIARSRKRLEDMKRRMQEIEQALDRRTDKREKIIENHVDDLLRAPELRWEMNMP